MVHSALEVRERESILQSQCVLVLRGNGHAAHNREHEHRRDNDQYALIVHRQALLGLFLVCHCIAIRPISDALGQSTCAAATCYWTRYQAQGMLSML